MRAVEVGGDEVGSGVCVASLEGGGDLAVLVDEASHPARVAREGGCGDALMPVAQGIVLAGEENVACGGDDRPVEAPVGLDEAAAAGVQGGLLRGDRGPELGRERPTRVRGTAGAVLLEQQAGFQHVLGFGGRYRHDEASAAGIQLEQTLGFELHEGVADGRAAESEAPGDLVLAEERAAREAAVEQALLDVGVCPARRGGATRSIRFGPGVVEVGAHVSLS